MHSGSTELQKFTFLIADDDADLRSVVARMLQRAGARAVHQATNGQEAMRFLTEKASMPDCVIADINMAPINGLQLAFSIRSSSQVARHDVPIVFISGHRDTILVNAARALDVNGFIAKPATRDDIIRRVSNALWSPLPIASRDVYEGRREQIFAQKHPILEASEPASVDGPDARQPQAIEVLLHQVPVGSILTKSISSRTGATLLARGVQITRAHLQSLEDLLGDDALDCRTSVILPQADL